MYNQLRGLQKKAKDLRQEVRNLRRMSQAQAHSVRETVRDTYIKIRLVFSNVEQFKLNKIMYRDIGRIFLAQTDFYHKCRI